MVKKITDFEITINRDNVFRLVDCDENSKVYSQVVEEFEEALEEAYRKIEPVALLAIGELGEFEDKIKGMPADEDKGLPTDEDKGMSTDGNKDMPTDGSQGILQGIYVIKSIGRKISEWSTQLFGEGDYLKGMLVDAIADDYLFQMNETLKPVIVKMCLERGFGVARRLEAPHDVPMDIQKKVWEITKAKEWAGIEIKESFMCDPVKTTCKVFLLKENSRVFHVGHNCNTCPNLNCKLRKTGNFEITVETADGLVVLPGERGESLLAILQKNNVPITAICGSGGTCGKCKVLVIEGEIPPSKGDIKFFREQEIAEGYRLACYAYPESSCAIKIETQREEIQTLTIMEIPEGVKSQKATEVLKGFKEKTYGVAVDIGTTTLAMQLVNLKTGDVEDVYTAINSQRSFGADVISRIEASNKGKGEALRKTLLLDVQEGIEHFLLKKKESNKKISIEKMQIAANTTLVHLMMGYSCKTLGVAPFTPVNIEPIQTSYLELFKGVKLGKEKKEVEENREGLDFSIMIFPGISTYVGGDIVAGLYALDIYQQDKVSILIDLGTNGEIAIGNKHRILTTSAAAGPAFEGGNISCGVGSVPGGIYGVAFEDEKPLVQTIGNKAPIGICGTGVVDLVYEMLKAGLINETGRLEGETFREGFLLAHTEQGQEIIVTQKDIREIQLAKAAMRAGLETLIHRYGVTYEQVDKIYIAGGFGYKLDIVKAIGIGLLPEEAKEKIIPVGNSALYGAKLGLCDGQLETSLQRIIDVAKEMNLGSDKEFNQFYMECMAFT